MFGNTPLIDQRLVGSYLLDGNYLYALCQQQMEDNHKSSAAFRLYDMEQLTEKDKPFSYVLRHVQVGC